MVNPAKQVLTAAIESMPRVVLMGADGSVIGYMGARHTVLGISEGDKGLVAVVMMSAGVVPGIGEITNRYWNDAPKHVLLYAVQQEE